MLDVWYLWNEKDFWRAIDVCKASADKQGHIDRNHEERLRIFGDLIYAYAARYVRDRAKDAPHALRIWMTDRGGKRPADLGRIIGSRSHASEILNRKRRLTTAQAYRIHKQWGIPAEVLIKPYDLEPAPKRRGGRGARSGGAAAAGEEDFASR